MAVSQISICNSALLKIGAVRISSIDQDTKSAIHLKAVWDQIRDSVMRAHPWNFAKARVTLAPNGTTPAWGYDFTYDLPNDWLRMLEPDNNDVEFVVEGQQLLTNESTLNVKYLFRNEDESSWDACFAECMAWRLATELAYNMTQSATVVQYCGAGYKAALAEARAMNAFDNNNFPELESTTWTDSRR